jgi:DNA/RNA endonuclease G (NUC1)
VRILRQINTRLPVVTIALAVLLAVSSLWAAPKPIVPAEGYEHDKWVTMPTEIVRRFRAYVVSFDGLDDDTGDGQPDANGQPEWVAYEIKATGGRRVSGNSRPGWFTDNNLAAAGIAPKDDTYRNSGYDRGHMCAKLIASMLGPDADYNTHTTLNACPQDHVFNDGIWGDLEERTLDWADKYGRVWVICGPVFSRRAKWIGDEGEMRIPVPDAFYKIVVRESESGPKVIAFLYPHQPIRKQGGVWDHRPYVVTVDLVEALTGLDFLTALPDDQESAAEGRADVDGWLATGTD